MFRPFKNTKEFIDDYQAKFKGSGEFIWLRSKFSSSLDKLLVTRFTENYVNLGDGRQADMSTLLDSYLYLDGSVCGKEK